MGKFNYFLVLYKIIRVINKSNKNSDNFSLILEKLIIILETNLSKYSNNVENRAKVCDDIKTLIMFIYIIYFNIESSENVILFFKLNNYNMIKIIKKAIIIFKDDKENVSVANFIINICFDDMKKKIYSFNDKNLEELYHKHVYSKILGIFPSFNDQFNFKNKEFSNFIKNITEMKLDDYIKDLKKDNSDIFCKSLIPILLSSEDFDFISFYINIINKHIEIIRKEYNNELTSLFRKDDVTNDLIKDLIVIFGNYTYIKSFYIVIPNEFLSTNEVTFDLDSFEKFLNNFITTLTKSMHFIIKVLLNIIENCIQEINSGADNYNVIYTVLIFNFFISPTILDIYGISMVKFRSLRQLTRILRNICFGKEFDNKDKLSYFNKKIKSFNSFINEEFRKNVFTGIDIKKDKENINRKINNLLVNGKNINNKGEESIVLPLFCYQYYWESIKTIINSVKNKNQ